MNKYNLENIPFNIVGSSKPVEDPEGIIGVYDAQGNLIDVPARAITYIEVLDAVSEGTIDGLIEGTYDFTGVAGNTGWESAKYSEYDDAPNLSGVKWLRSVYWDKVPVINSENQYNFQQVDMNYVTGTSAGAYDSSTKKVLGLDNPELKVSHQINDQLFGSKEDRVTSGGTIDASSDYTRIYRIDNIYAKGCIINIRVNQLYRSINVVDDPDYPAGSVVSTRVDYKIYYKPYFSNQEKNPKAYTLGAQDYIEGKITNGMLKPTRVNFYNANLQDPDFRGWEIAVIRQTPESETVSIRNQTFVDSLTEIYQEVYIYPNTAIIRNKFSAEFFTSVPNRAFHVKGIKVKVPSNYNTTLRTYGQARGGLTGGAGFDNGIGGGKTAVESGDATVNGTTDAWDGTFKATREYTNNPAWIFYDLISNPIYGLGHTLDGSNINKWALYEIAQYCDGLVLSEYGELEPRFTCNLVLTTREDAIKVLQNLASIFRGLIFYKSGSIFATFDRSFSNNRVFTFNNANVENGEFIYKSTAKKSRTSVAIVRYNDKTNFYKPAVELVEDAEAIKRNGIIQKELTAFGCTSKGQARRLGLWTILTDTYNTETVSFKTGLDGAYIQPNDIIAIADKYKKINRNTGRTMGIFGGAMTEDSYGTYHLTVNGSVTATANTAGKVGGAILLGAGFNDLHYADGGVFDPDQSSFSIAGWFKYTGTGNQTIVSKKETNDDGWEVYVNATTKRLIFRIEDTNGDVASVTASTYGDVNASTWYFFTASIDKASDLLKIQIDGGAVDTASISSIDTIRTLATTYMRIGSDNGATQQFIGNIDQICIWSGHALGSGQGYELYNNGSGVHLSEMGYNAHHLVSCYDLQDGPTVVLDDNITSIDSGNDYLLSVVTPTYNYYHDVSDLDSSDLSDMQKPSVQNIAFNGTEHQVRNNISTLFLENSFDRTDYNVSGNLIYSIERTNYTTGDAANFVNITGDYFKVLGVSSEENGTQFNITAVQYSPEKFAQIDERTSFERKSETVNVPVYAPVIGKIIVEDTNPSYPTPNPPIVVIDPVIPDTGDFLNPFEADPNVIPPSS